MVDRSDMMEHSEQRMRMGKGAGLVWLGLKGPGKRSVDSV